MAAKNELSVDGDLVRALAALLEETGLSEIEYAVGERRIRVARGAVATSLVAAPAPTSPAPAAPPPSPGTAPAPEPAGAVKAPMVGIVHVAPQPGAPPFVQLGDTVREGQTLFIVEAMKVMNQIPAPRAGRVAQILITNGAPVEFGQVLAVIE